MSIRATYALDEQTDQRIKQLARDWHVSQAEVIRRSIRTVAEQAQRKLTPADVLVRYSEGPLPRSPEETERRIRDLREWRHADDESRLVKGE
ncbi:ribbon-helix-helix protein, CopG family [Salinisphaera sp.]|uniref:ribbon-helix-helix protein, CopG family n=1 Tax=Salinisphaera sp. TaxID=1914330 RepID=UPI002D78380F|nr:ribbon-helix-helix protein, CopG family [Salinisphaera sp.]HET7313785.1 ribbon-helix-helix protein, CopG family [Salinisphaera sp.]